MIGNVCCQKVKTWWVNNRVFERLSWKAPDETFHCKQPEVWFYLFLFSSECNVFDCYELPCFMVCFQCLTPMPIHIPIPIPILCRKAPQGPIPMVIPMQSYYENYFKNHLTGTNIGVKLGTVPICIRIGIGIGSVETVLHIIILAIWIGIRIGIGIGMGVKQWKHTIRRFLDSVYHLCLLPLAIPQNMGTLLLNVFW